MSPSAVTSLTVVLLFANTEKEYYMFVFSPKRDMHWLRAKEIKDSPNSQAVPKILQFIKNDTAWFHTGSGSASFSDFHLPDTECHY